MDQVVSISPPIAAEQPKARRRWPVFLVGAVLLLAAGGIGFGLGRATVQNNSEAFAVTGTIDVPKCQSSGYDDVRVGAQVVITNQQNAVLGATSLKAKGVCLFEFSIPEIPSGERMYGVHVGNSNRGIIWKTEAEARSEGFHLTLGS
ncbi:hypothetical protein Lesp02_19480 [Lentzea sp. NBRC 105346]|uniref:hypothetical protein n=1 Tax=Lentzea sp. NBRC 105346 TaxID=3032205 RepID=UPI0024A29550|nr:hypothetical protein [Lentzea sp. NBRC 105346]GLZ29758.1 hypothetical protein Lesp02_19480 [Lentzea sp. NBRC 105346]